MELTDADFNMRKEFYKESKLLAEDLEKKVAIRFKCPKCGFIATTNMGQCLSCGYRPKDLKDLLK